MELGHRESWKGFRGHPMTSHFELDEETDTQKVRGLWMGHKPGDGQNWNVVCHLPPALGELVFGI